MSRSIKKICMVEAIVIAALLVKTMMVRSSISRRQCPADNVRVSGCDDLSADPSVRASHLYGCGRKDGTAAQAIPRPHAATFREVRDQEYRASLKMWSHRG